LALKTLGRRLSTFECPNVLAPPFFERPIPLVFFAGEGLNNITTWNNTIKFMSNRGFHGLSLELPDLDDIDEVTDSMNYSIQKAKLTNPIIISHSIGTFVAQKYLESYSASALILINPIPPQNHTKSISKLYEIKSSINNTNKFVQKYYKNNNIYNDDISSSNCFPPFIGIIKSDPSAAVNIEPNACDMLIITTKGDYDMGILDENDVKQMQSYHSLEDEDIIHLQEENSRLPFITNSSLCNKVIYDFCDEIY